VPDASEAEQEIPIWNFDAKANSNMQYIKDSSKPIKKENKKKQGKRKSKKHRRT
jgi:hypothetical protein